MGYNQYEDTPENLMDDVSSDISSGINNVKDLYDKAGNAKDFINKLNGSDSCSPKHADALNQKKSTVDFPQNYTNTANNVSNVGNTTGNVAHNAINAGTEAGANVAEGAMGATAGGATSAGVTAAGGAAGAGAGGAAGAASGAVAGPAGLAVTAILAGLKKGADTLTNLASGNGKDSSGGGVVLIIALVLSLISFIPITAIVFTPISIIGTIGNEIMDFFGLDADNDEDLDMSEYTATLDIEKVALDNKKLMDKQFAKAYRQAVKEAKQYCKSNRLKWSKSKATLQATNSGSWREVYENVNYGHLISAVSLAKYGTDIDTYTPEEFKEFISNVDLSYLYEIEYEEAEDDNDGGFWESLLDKLFTPKGDDSGEDDYTYEDLTPEEKERYDAAMKAYELAMEEYNSGRSDEMPIMPQVSDFIVSSSYAKITIHYYTLYDLYMIANSTPEGLYNEPNEDETQKSITNFEMQNLMLEQLRGMYSYYPETYDKLNLDNDDIRWSYDFETRTPEDLWGLPEGDLSDIDLPENLANNRKIFIEYATAYVGAIRYYYGGKPSVQGFEGNGFGTTVAPDAKGRTIRGLDCSGFVGWCYWTCFDYKCGMSTGNFTSSLNARSISKSELKPGDIGLKGAPGTGNNHIGIYLGKSKSTGADMWVHCSGSGGGVVMNSTNCFTLFYNIFD